MLYKYDYNIVTSILIDLTNKTNKIVCDIYVSIDKIVNVASVRSNFDCDREGRRQICVERITSGINLNFPS